MKYRNRFLPVVADDLKSIVEMTASYAGQNAVERRLAEIEGAVFSPADTPHKCSIRAEIAPGLRAIPAGRKAVVAFTVDDVIGTVFVDVVGHAGSNWVQRTSSRGP